MKVYTYDRTGLRLFCLDFFSFLFMSEQHEVSIERKKICYLSIFLHFLKPEDNSG